MARVGCDRRNAKVAIFSILYEITPRTLARKLSMATEDWGITEADAQRLIDGIYSAYPGLRNMQDDLADAARRSGYAETLTGFKRLIPARSWCGTRGSVAHTRRIAINTPIQGSAGGIMKRIMRSLSERWGESGLMAQGVTLLAQVHDELLVEAPESLADRVNSEMAEAFKGAAPELRVPLDSSGGIGPNWSEAKHG
jgi:DNA polymerase-1